MAEFLLLLTALYSINIFIHGYFAGKGPNLLKSVSAEIAIDTFLGKDLALRSAQTNVGGPFTMQTLKHLPPTHPKITATLKEISSLLQSYSNDSHTGGIKIEINMAQGVPSRVYLIKEEKALLKN